MYNRLKEVFRESGLQEEFDKENKNVSLYSFRHQYACWRLRYGDVPIHLLAKQMGTSVSKIESTYGHIMVVEQADQITKNQEYLRRMDIILDTPEVVEEDD
jgi:integrase